MENPNYCICIYNCFFSNTSSNHIQTGGKKVANNHKYPNKFHLFLLFIVIAVLIWSLIKPLRYSSWAAEGGPILIGLIVVLATYRRFPLTTLSYIIIAILAILEFIGGHYTFAKVPLFDWIKEEFDLKRNDYDRLGHFVKGLAVIIIREIIIRKTQVQKGAWLFLFSFSILMMIAALYEIVEMLSYKIVKGSQMAKGFLGMQGDRWDSQWDMTMALIGAIIGYIVLARLHDKLLMRMRKE